MAVGGGGVTLALCDTLGGEHVIWFYETPRRENLPILPRFDLSTTGMEGAETLTTWPPSP